MKYILPFILAVAATMCRCGRGDTVAGGGSERPNPAFTTGPIVAPGSIVSGIRGIMYAVSVDADGYAWEAVDTSYTGTDGTFTINELDPGYYSLVMESNGYLGFSGYFLHDSLTVIDSIVLNMPRSVRGMIYDSTGVPAGNVILGLVGTAYADTLAPADSGVFAFPALPAGDFKMEIGSITLVNGTAAGSLNVSVVDSFLLNPDLVKIHNAYISMPETAPAGTVYTTGYGLLPAYHDAVAADTVSGTGGTIDVVGTGYRIKIIAQ